MIVGTGDIHFTFSLFHREGIWYKCIGNDYYLVLESTDYGRNLHFGPNESTSKLIWQFFVKV